MPYRITNSTRVPQRGSLERYKERSIALQQPGTKKYITDSIIPGEKNSTEQLGTIFLIYS